MEVASIVMVQCEFVLTLSSIRALMAVLVVVIREILVGISCRTIRDGKLSMLLHCTSDFDANNSSEVEEWLWMLV